MASSLVFPTESPELREAARKWRGPADLEGSKGDGKGGVVDAEGQGLPDFRVMLHHPLPLRSLPCFESHFRPPEGQQGSQR